MDWDQIEGNWKQLTGKVKEQWGKLTDDDLVTIDGSASSSKARCKSATALPRMRPGSTSTIGSIRLTTEVALAPYRSV